MSVETLIVGALNSLVSNRVYPDVVPQDVTALPRITFQQVGGQAVNYLENAIPSKHNSRFQINVWAATRLQAKALSLQVAAALKAVTALHPTILNEPLSVYELETGLYGTIQDFSFWV